MSLATIHFGLLACGPRALVCFLARPDTFSCTVAWYFDERSTSGPISFSVWWSAHFHCKAYLHPQETYVYKLMKWQTSLQGHLQSISSSMKRVEHFSRFCRMEWAPLPNGQLCQGIRLPPGLKSDFYEHGLGMINFCMNLRSCICFHTWGVWMGLQDHHQQGLGGQLPDHLNDAFVYVALRLEADRVYTGLQSQTWRVWNRRFCDFFLHSTQDVNFTELELSTMRI